MTDTNRESKIIAAVACPACGTPIGRPCRVLRGRPMVCAERKRAWQAQRDARPVDYVLTPHHEGPAGQRTAYTLVAPQSAAAATALRALVPTLSGRMAWIGGALSVPHDEMPALTRRLIAEGWRTAETI